MFRTAHPVTATQGSADDSPGTTLNMLSTFEMLDHIGVHPAQGHMESTTLLLLPNGSSWCFGFHGVSWCNCLGLYFHCQDFPQVFHCHFHVRRLSIVKDLWEVLSNWRVGQRVRIMFLANHRSSLRASVIMSFDGFSRPLHAYYGEWRHISLKMASRSLLNHPPHQTSWVWALSLSLCRAWLLAVSQRRPLNMTQTAFVERAGRE